MTVKELKQLTTLEGVEEYLESEASKALKNHERDIHYKYGAAMALITILANNVYFTKKLQ